MTASREAYSCFAYFCFSFIALALVFPIWQRIASFYGDWPGAIHAYAVIAFVATSAHVVGLLPILKIGREFAALRGLIRGLVVFGALAAFTLRIGTFTYRGEIGALLHGPFFSEWRFIGFIFSYGVLAALGSLLLEWYMSRQVDEANSIS